MTFRHAVTIGPGGGSPRPVTRGETSPDQFSALGVGVDWLAFTYTPANAGRVWREGLAFQLEEWFGVEGWEEKRGWQGYECSARIGPVLIAWGGEHQRGSVHVEIPGAVCGGCTEWEAVAAWLERIGARLTRVDLCADDYYGERVSVDWGLAQFAEGGFTARAGGVRGSGKLVDDLGSGAGRTLYVGKRENGKLARVYEKGRQLGDKLSQWCRVEVEWRSKDRVLAYDMLTHPLRYLAGAYPCLGFLSGVQVAIRTFKNRAVLSYAQVVRNARMQAGRAINAMLQIARGDLGEVVTLLRRSGLPKRLDALDVAALTSG